MSPEQLVTSKEPPRTLHGPGPSPATTSGVKPTAERFSRRPPHMSTTQTTSDATVPTPSPATNGERALEFFNETIWKNFQVCNHCFECVKRRMQGTVAKPTGETVDIDESWRTPTATLGEDLEEAPDSVAGVQPLPRPRTTCESCGSVGAISQTDTLSRRAALQRVPKLVQRIREQGFAIEERVVRSIVRSLKSKPEYESDDKHVFATAVALGVDRA